MMKRKTMWIALGVIWSCCACSSDHRQQDAAIEEAGKRYAQAKSHYANSDYPRADSLFGEAALLAIEVEDSLLLGRCLNNRGVCHLRMEVASDVGISYFYEALDIYHKLGEDGLAAETSYNVGNRFKREDVYPLAQEFLLKSLSLMERQGQHPRKVEVLSALGNLERNMGNFAQSQRYFRHADSLLQLGESSISMQAKIYLHRGQTYREQGELKRAAEDLEQAIALFQQLNDSDDLASAQAQLGEVFLSDGKLFPAEQLFINALQLQRHGGRLQKIISGYHHLAALRIAQSSFEETRLYLDSAFALMDKKPTGGNLEDNLNLRIQLEISTGNLLEALALKDQQKQLGDSLLSVQNRYLIAGSNARYRLEQRKRENETLAANLALSNYQLAGAVMLILIVAIILYFVLRQSQQRKRARNKVARLLREMNHRIKNNLQSLSTTLKLEQQQLEKRAHRDPEEVIRNAQNRLLTMELIHVNLSQTTEESMGDIQLDNYVDGLVEGIGQAWAEPHREITQRLELEPLLLDANKVLRFGLVINEVVTNAYKHALGPANYDPRLTILLGAHNHDQAELVVHDNGSGFDEATISDESEGLQLCRDLMDELQGSIHFLKEEGTTVRLRVRL